MALEKTTIGDLVAEDFRAASIFKEAGIDFCCGGGSSLEDTCREKGLDIAPLIEQLSDLSESSPSSTINFKDWSPDFLCDYIVNTHHAYVRKTLPELLFYTNKIADVHGEHHPELAEVASLFKDIHAELTQHMAAEEDVLFPAIRDILIHPSEDTRQTIQVEISRMREEHEFAGGAMDRINEITKGYELPADACNTYQVCLKMLEQFEDDLHVHVHLENNILFKKASEI